MMTRFFRSREVILIAAISNEGKVHFMTYLGTMNAALFVVFLQRLL